MGSDRPAGQIFWGVSQSLALVCVLVGWAWVAHRETAGTKPSPNYFSFFCFLFKFNWLFVFVYRFLKSSCVLECGFMGIILFGEPK